MRDIEVLHVCSAPSASQFVALRKAVKHGQNDVGYGMPESSFIFHDLLRTGLAQYPSARVLSLVGRPTHPTVHARTFWKTVLEHPSASLTILQVGIVNLRWLKQVWVGLGIFSATLKWRFRTASSKQRILLIDAAYVSALPFVLLALKGSGVRRLGIFADIYAYMGDVCDARGTATRLQAVLRGVVGKCYSAFDGFVLLTQQMDTVVNTLGRPSMVMEGLINGERPALSSPPAKSVQPTILYAGALRKEYGLDDLLEGFMTLERPEARLVIFGEGPYASTISDAAQVDSRITFGGRIGIPEVMHEQQRAWVLVNTRRDEDEFTKYSFPSKLLSYMASGTAVLTTRLPGMPSEYEDHIFIIDGFGSEAVNQSLGRILNLPFEDLEIRADGARSFVQSKKNNVVQTARIIDFALELK